MAKKPRLSRETWVEAALDAIAEAGISGVAVEPLAARLGVTKGSFYWHFRDRDELLAASLEAWEGERTGSLIEQLDAVDDPRERLAEWGRRVLGADKTLLVRLHAAADHPIVTPVLRRVTERRIAWLADVLREAGVSPAAARRRARLLYSADLGLSQVARALPSERPTDGELSATVREIQQAFLPEARPTQKKPAG